MGEVQKKRDWKTQGSSLAHGTEEHVTTPAQATPTNSHQNSSLSSSETKLDGKVCAASEAACILAGIFPLLGQSMVSDARNAGSVSTTRHEHSQRVVDLPTTAQTIQAAVRNLRDDLQHLLETVRVPRLNAQNKGQHARQAKSTAAAASGQLRATCPSVRQLLRVLRPLLQPDGSALPGSLPTRSPGGDASEQNATVFASSLKASVNEQHSDDHVSREALFVSVANVSNVSGAPEPRGSTLVPLPIRQLPPRSFSQGVTRPSSVAAGPIRALPGLAIVRDASRRESSERSPRGRSVTTCNVAHGTAVDVIRRSRCATVDMTAFRTEAVLHVEPSSSSRGVGIYPESLRSSPAKLVNCERTVPASSSCSESASSSPAKLAEVEEIRCGPVVLVGAHSVAPPPVPRLGGHRSIADRNISDAVPTCAASNSMAGNSLSFAVLVATGATSSDIRGCLRRVHEQLGEIQQNLERHSSRRRASSAPPPLPCVPCMT